MLVAALHAGVGLVLLYLGGEGLVRGATNLALRLGIGPLAVGLTVVAFGTSAPELAVSLDAALEGFEEVAVGNVVGSNICNLALILGLSSVLRPMGVQPQVLRVDAPVMAGCALLLVVMLVDGRVSRMEGALLVGGILTYVATSLRRARREHRENHHGARALAGRPGSLAVDAAFVLVGLGGLGLGGKLFVQGAVELAELLGVSQAVIGLTVVAVGTSLPELATSVVGAARGQGDIAIGNLIGSNIFNVLAILGLTALVHPLARGGVGWWDIGAMAAICVAILPLLATRLRLGRVEGLLLLAGYGVWLFGSIVG